MIRCRWSLNVSRRRSPIWSQLGGQGLGGDDQRVDRDHLAALAVQRRRVALGRADHVSGAHVPCRVTTEPARSPSRGSARRWSTPRRTTASARPRTSRAGMDGRAVAGCTSRRARVPRPRPRRLVGVEQPDVVLVEAPRTGVLDLGLGACHCGCRPGQPDRAALGGVGVDALVVGRPQHLVDACRASRVRAARGQPLAASAGDARGRGNSAEHQPPLRPDAPKPAVSASSTAIRSDGSASAR